MGVIEVHDLVHRKSVLEYVSLDPSNKGGPKYGHYAEIDPAFGAVKEYYDALVGVSWQNQSWEAARQMWNGVPPNLPTSCPEPGRDVSESYQKIPTRDGAEIEIKIMKSVHNTSKAGNACVLRIHGGGWVSGTHLSEKFENLYAAAHPHTVLVSVDYRLAPVHRYPIPLNDCMDALRWVKDHATTLGINPEKIVIAGSSAGANLTLCVALQARDQGISGIVGLVLNFPVSCHPKFFPQMRKQGYELESYVQNSEASLVRADIMEFFWDAYVPNDVQPDLYHSPLLADSLKGLPPTFIQVGGYDPLRDEALAMAEKLQQNGVSTELHVYPGLPHCFPVILVDQPQSVKFQQRQNAFINKLIDA